MTLAHCLIVSALLLAAGIATWMLRRNPVGILMGTELILSAATLNLVAFNRFLPAPVAASGVPRVDGQILALFTILLGALQVALALAIFINLRAQRTASEAAPGDEQFLPARADKGISGTIQPANR